MLRLRQLGQVQLRKYRFRRMPSTRKLREPAGRSEVIDPDRGDWMSLAAAAGHMNRTTSPPEDLRDGVPAPSTPLTARTSRYTEDVVRRPRGPCARRGSPARRRRRPACARTPGPAA